MLSEDSDAFWDESSSKAVSFSFDDHDEQGGFVKVEKIDIEKLEKEKEKVINSPAYTVKYRSSEIIKPNTLIFGSDRIVISSPQQSQRSTDSLVTTGTELDVCEAVKQLVLGKPYILEPFKSFYQKQQLLTQAIAWHDGNAIVTVVLFLKQTLSENMFLKLLLQSSVALDHYLKYLVVVKDHIALNSILMKLGRNEEAFFASYCLAIASQHPETKLNRISNFAAAHKNFVGMEFVNSKIKEQIELLERQLPIEEQDAAIEKSGKNLIFQNVKRPALPNLSVIATLHYCCLYHFYSPENNITNPSFVRKVHQLTDKQFIWTALKAFTRLELWKDIDALFQTKSWLGTNTTRSAIGFENVVIMLDRAKAPFPTISKYMSLVETPEKRLALARKLKYHNIAVDNMVSLRDRLALVSYCTELIPNSREHRYALEALRAPSIKWKN